MAGIHLNRCDASPIWSRAEHGTEREITPIRVVAVDSALHMRSPRSSGGAWDQHAATSGQGIVRNGSKHIDVTLVAADAGVRAAIDDRHRAEYGTSSYRRAMLTNQAVGTTPAPRSTELTNGSTYQRKADL